VTRESAGTQSQNSVPRAKLRSEGLTSKANLVRAAEAEPALPSPPPQLMSGDEGDSISVKHDEHIWDGKEI